MRHSTVRLLIVDDQSPDGTALLANELARTYPGRITVMNLTGRRGLGRAYIDGFKAALATSADLILSDGRRPLARSGAIAHVDREGRGGRSGDRLAICAERKDCQLAPTAAGPQPLRQLVLCGPSRGSRRAIALAGTDVGDGRR